LIRQAIVDDGSDRRVEIGSTCGRPIEGDWHHAFECQGPHAIRKAAGNLKSQARAVRHAPHVDPPHGQRIEDHAVIRRAGSRRITGEIGACGQLIAARGEPHRIEDSAHDVGHRGRRRAMQPVRSAGAALVDQDEIVTIADRSQALRERATERGGALPRSASEQHHRISHRGRRGSGHHHHVNP
jgi:hypothetical protein